MFLSTVFNLPGTKERTEKIGMSSIKTVVNEPIEGHEEYHILVCSVFICVYAWF